MGGPWSLWDTGLGLGKVGLFLPALPRGEAPDGKKADGEGLWKSTFAGASLHASVTCYFMFTLFI